MIFGRNHKLPEAAPAALVEGMRDLIVFHNVARALTSSLDLDAILRVILSQMEKFFQPASWTLLVVDEKAGDLYYAVVAGHTGDGLQDVRVPIGDGLAGWVAQHGETLIVPEVSDDSRYSPTPAQFPAGEGSLHIRSAICLPLRSRERTLGVIELFNCDLDTFTDYTISFLHVLCDFAAIAIENADAVRRIQELTITDDCTSLFNVRHLYERLEQEIERSRRFRTPISLIFIDLDYFKRVNDRHGHLVGSLLLNDVGQKIQSLVRSIDSTFRYGGDEFVVLLPSTGKEAALEVARRLCDALRAASFFVRDRVRIEVRASFGVATFPHCGATVHEIIGKADQAMYSVKNTTRDGVAAAPGDARFPA